MHNAPVITIGDRPIGPGHPPYVIAEMSANHLGDFDRAMRILEVAAACGADAVKLQTYTADTLTIESERPEFHIQGGPWNGYSLHALYREAHTPWAWHQALFARGRELGVAVFSSPFDDSAVELLEALAAPAYKIASFELVDHGLIERCARTGKPLILSTGLSSPEEIDEAVAVARRASTAGVAVLHCISGYPAAPAEFNLRRMAAIAAQTGAVVGISDHSPGATIPIAAAALGACIVEKHLTLRRDDGGPDAGFSLEPDEFAAVVAGVRTAWQALGTGEAERASSEAQNHRYRRSLYAVRDIGAGAPITAEDVRSIRPNLGLAPKHLPAVLGRRAACAIACGTPMAWELLA